MTFVLQLRTEFQHPFRVNYKTKIRIIDPFPTKNGVNLCKLWRENITESELWIKSKEFKPLR